MELSYNCQLTKLEKKRKAALKDRGEQLNLLLNKRTAGECVPEETVASIRRDIKDLLDSREIVDFLVDAQPFMMRFSDLERWPSSTSCQERRTLLVEFTDRFGEQMDTPSDVKARHCAERMTRARQDINISTCKYCKTKYSMVDDTKAASFVCVSCGVVDTYGIPDGPDGLTFDEKMNMPSPPYTYKPIQHFTDLLNAVQGKTRKVVPPEVLMQLRLECLKRKFDMDTVHPEMVRQLLRMINRMDLYDEKYAIANALNPKYKLVSISDEDQGLLKSMFREVYRRFPDAKNKVNPERKNFMSYNHLARVLCDFMGLTKYSHEFTWLKNRDKRKKHDEMLRYIFEELGWEFRSTV